MTVELFKTVVSNRQQVRKPNRLIAPITTLSKKRLQRSSSNDATPHKHHNLFSDHKAQKENSPPLKLDFFSDYFSTAYMSDETQPNGSLVNETQDQQPVKLKLTPRPLKN